MSPCVIENKNLASIKRQGDYRSLTTPATVACKPLKIFGAHSLEMNLERKLPARSIATVRNCLVSGQSAALFTRGWLHRATHWAVLPEVSLGNAAGNYAEFFGRHRSGWTFNVNPTLNPQRQVKRGVLIGSRYSFNHFHFVCDTLIRALIADEAAPDTRTWPLVITEGSYQQSQFIRTLFPEREIIVLTSNELILFNELLVPVASSFSPDDPNSARLAVYDVPYIKDLQIRLMGSNPGQVPDPTNILFVKRKFYQAPNGEIARTILNQDEVISFLDGFGAIAISPEEMSFSDQRELFHSANTVVAMAGAALANAVFCRPGTNIIIICQDRNVFPEYFCLMLEELGLRVSVVASKGVQGSSHHPSHLSVIVDIADLRDALNWCNIG
jgi:hypothetical protein